MPNGMTNKACLFIYWACATDQDLLEKLTDPATNNDAKKQMLFDDYGIPSEYIENSCLETLKSHKVAFAMFEGATFKRCPEPICWDRTREDFPAELNRAYFAGDHA